MFEVRFQVLLPAVKELLRLEISGTEGQKVNCCQSCLFAGGYKYDGLEFWGVSADGVVDWFHHGDEARRSVSDVEALWGEGEWGCSNRKCVWGGGGGGGRDKGRGGVIF